MEISELFVRAIVISGAVCGLVLALVYSLQALGVL